MKTGKQLPFYCKTNSSCEEEVAVVASYQVELESILVWAAIASHNSTADSIVGHSVVFCIRTGKGRIPQLNSQRSIPRRPPAGSGVGRLRMYSTMYDCTPTYRTVQIGNSFL